MFDTLVCGLEEAEQPEFAEEFEIFRGSKPVADEIFRKTPCLGVGRSTVERGEDEATRDPILQYLQRYYAVSDHPDLSDVGDLSWDEGDLPHQEIKVWTFNDFMGQYNQLYAYLNNIQVQYHSAKKSSSASPRVEGLSREKVKTDMSTRDASRVEALLKDLERDVERRERFLRECGRMVGAFPELEEEVGWRVEHVIAKWEMLSQLRGKVREPEAMPDIYSDIELEVRCLRRWLREMEARIDPLQFSGIQQWSPGDREKKMAEYQVLQTDIESHGRIVKLVLGLCQELSQDPGLYDLQHAVKVARSLERRWHHIWLRSLEWQCLLEQWIQGGHPDDSVFDTDDEPLSKVPRLASDLGSCTASPAATLLRRKRRKRWPCSPREEEGEESKRAVQEVHILQGSEVQAQMVFQQEEEERRSFTKMQTSESEPSTAPSTARSESSDSMNSLNNGEKMKTSLSCNEEEEEKYLPEFRGSLDNDNEHVQTMPVTPLNILEVLDDIIDVDETSHDGFWDTSDEDAFVENKNKLMQKVRKVTVVQKSSPWALIGQEKGEGFGKQGSEQGGRKTSEEFFSQDSLEQGAEEEEEEERRRSSAHQMSSSSCSSSTEEEEEGTDKETLATHPAPADRAEVQPLTSLLNFGDDYRKYIDSLSDSSCSVQRVRGSRRVKKRSMRRREGLHGCPYESQSEAELEETCIALSSSQASMERVEQSATSFFSKPPHQRDNAVYEEILAECSQNVNLLFHLLDNVTKGESFAKQKKCRDIRLLIGRWERLLQTVSESVHNATVHSGLRDQIDRLKESLGGFQTGKEGNDEKELDVRLTAIKAEQARLEEQKAVLLSISLAVHTFLADLSTSSHVDTQHKALANQLKQEVVELYSLWDLCHHQTSGEFSKVEACLQQLSQVQLELGELRAELSLENDALLVRAARQEGKTENTSEDSGWSSGWASEDCNLPGKQERLGRICQMARGLQQVLSPRSESCQAVTRSLEATAAELSALQKTYLSLKSGSRGFCRRKGGKTEKAAAVLGRRVDKDKLRARAVAGACGNARRRRITRCCLGLNIMLLLLLFLSWVCQPTCCDTLTVISSFSPQLQYVNGPPPI